MDKKTRRETRNDGRGAPKLNTNPDSSCSISFLLLLRSQLSLEFTILLLLLRSQLYLWDSSFFFFFCVLSYISGVHHYYSSSAFPAISLGFTILLLLRFQLYLWGWPIWVRWLHMWPLCCCCICCCCCCCCCFNTTIAVVTFRLRGWYMLSVFSLPAFTRPGCECLGHQCQDESVRWNPCVHRLDLGFYSHPKEFWRNWVRTHVNSKGKVPSTGSSEEDRTHDAKSSRTASLTHYRLSYPPPPPPPHYSTSDRRGLQFHC